MKCPEHKGELIRSKLFAPKNGLDPKMKRYCCLECVDYWYYTPKLGLHRIKGMEFKL